MDHPHLADLLDRNEVLAAGLAADTFAALQDGQRPPVVSVCCSDSRVSQEGMWEGDDVGYLFTAGNIGNRVSAVVDGERVLDGSVAYPLAHAGTVAVAVVGHTGCGAVGAALDAVRTGEYPAQAGVRADVEELVPIVEAGIDEHGVDPDTDDARDRLVEHNVHEQVRRAREAGETDDASVYGFVYDFHRSYGGRDGITYLVNVDGERDPDALREAVPDEHAGRVASLLR